MRNTLSPASLPPTQHDSPAAAYRGRLAALQLSEKHLEAEHRRLGYVRLVFGLASVVLLFPPVPFVLLPLIGFGLAARIHQRVLRHLAATRRTLTHYEHALARVEDRWSGRRPRTTRLDTSSSLYAADLDLFGPGSLFELLCEGRTSLGEDTLAAWLLTPAPAPEVAERQRAVADLRERLPLREAVAGAPGSLLPILDPAALGNWAEAGGQPLPQVLSWIAPVLVTLTLMAAWRSAATHSLGLIALMLGLDATVTFLLQRAYKPLFDDLQRAQRALPTVAALIAHFERVEFHAPRPQLLQAQLKTPHSTASQAFAQVARLSDWIDARSNYLVRIVDAPLLYSLQLALAVQRWRTQNGPQLRQWLQTCGEFEALLSLAAYSFEQPNDPFPQITAGFPAFSAVELGHPLLPASACVRNDLTLDQGTRLLLVSGSNMSGKSTLLRAVGINAVLAFAGAPVRARALTLSPLTVAASIQVNDSLQAGRSRFYAEILRLRAVTEAARTQPPVLFLLDELLAGTNSSDRLIGAEGIVRDLLRNDALGLLSTHDLSLTSVGTGHNALTRNVHFEDRIVDGQLQFDYKLREGVVERSNGVDLMRVIGLDV